MGFLKNKRRQWWVFIIIRRCKSSRTILSLVPFHGKTHSQGLSHLSYSNLHSFLQRSFFFFFGSHSLFLVPSRSLMIFPSLSFSFSPSDLLVFSYFQIAYLTIYFTNFLFFIFTFYGLTFYFYQFGCIIHWCKMIYSESAFPLLKRFFPFSSSTSSFFNFLR